MPVVPHTAGVSVPCKNFRPQLLQETSEVSAATEGVI